MENNALLLYPLLFFVSHPQTNFQYGRCVQGESLLNFACPHIGHIDYRNRICPNAAQYICLLDANLNYSVESCKGPRFEKPGERTTINKGNFDVQMCPPQRYQPFIYKASENSNCELLKSKCEEIGLLTFRNGDSVTDRSCRCDYTKGYVFVQTPADKCQCFPSVEDCSCFYRPCPVNHVMSPDYECLPETLNPTNRNFTCPLKDEKEKETDNESKKRNFNDEDTSIFQALLKERAKLGLTAFPCLAITLLCFILAYITRNFKTRSITTAQRLDGIKPEQYYQSRNPPAHTPQKTSQAKNAQTSHNLEEISCKVQRRNIKLLPDPISQDVQDVFPQEPGSNLSSDISPNKNQSTNKKKPKSQLPFAGQAQIKQHLTGVTESASISKMGQLNQSSPPNILPQHELPNPTIVLSDIESEQHRARESPTTQGTQTGSSNKLAHHSHLENAENEREKKKEKYESNLQKRIPNNLRLNLPLRESVRSDADSPAVSTEEPESTSPLSPQIRNNPFQFCSTGSPSAQIGDTEQIAISKDSESHKIAKTCGGADSAFDITGSAEPCQQNNIDMGCSLAGTEASSDNCIQWHNENIGAINTPDQSDYFDWMSEVATNNMDS